MNKHKKKQLRELYKANPPAMGIYLITNRHNGKRLLGASENIPGKLNRLRMELTHGNSVPWRNTALQADWDQYGEAGFQFETLDTLTREDTTDQPLQHELAALLTLWQEKIPHCEYHTATPTQETHS